MCGFVVSDEMYALRDESYLAAPKNNAQKNMATRGKLTIAGVIRA